MRAVVAGANTRTEDPAASRSTSGKNTHPDNFCPVFMGRIDAAAQQYNDGAAPAAREV